MLTIIFIINLFLINKDNFLDNGYFLLKEDSKAMLQFILFMSFMMI